MKWNANEKFWYLSNWELYAALQLFWKYFNCLLLTDALFKSLLLTLCTKAFRLKNWSIHLTSLNEGASYKFFQWKQINSLEETVHFSKYFINVPCTQNKFLSQQGQHLPPVHFSSLFVQSHVCSRKGTPLWFSVAADNKLTNAIKTSNNEFLSVSIYIYGT
jgi:hypothetical protein